MEKHIRCKRLFLSLYVSSKLLGTLYSSLTKNNFSYIDKKFDVLETFLDNA